MVGHGCHAVLKPLAGIAVLGHTANFGWRMNEFKKDEACDFKNGSQPRAGHTSVLHPHIQVVPAALLPSVSLSLGRSAIAAPGRMKGNPSVIASTWSNISTV